jgi:hypothetical protein
MPDVFIGYVVVLLNKGNHSPSIYHTVLLCMRITSGISSVIFVHISGELVLCSAEDTMESLSALISVMTFFILV